ncbi:MAG: ComEC/Rec2 family competence protein [Candidatus Nomurabacteria bacterium]|nr:ComEC/Rec2 family competence protein [Candidatus Nomurabacteria bacterium]
MRNKFTSYLLIILVIVTVIRFYIIFIKKNPDIKLGFFSGTSVIQDESDIRETNQKLTVEIFTPQSRTFGSLKDRPFPVKILITTDLFTDYKYGDEIKFSGMLEKPDNFETDQGKIFDYINYLKKDGIYFLMKNPKIEILSRGNGNFLKSILFSAKEKFLEKMNRAIPEPESLLMGGLILGEKSSFSQALRQSFVNTGTIHIVALSGYNVTIVAEWIMKIFGAIYFVPKNFGIGMGIFSIVLFVLMTGGSSTAIRAGIMAVLALYARATGRNYDAGRALLFAGIIMILINPLLLVYDVSFQLSFLATIAVIFLSPKLEEYFYWIKWAWLRDIVCVTFSAYVFVTPFILYQMGNLSVIALPANILILPFIPLTMILGFITGFLGLIFFSLAIPFGYISYAFLHYELGAIAFFSNLPFASFTIPNFPLILVILIYLFFFYKLFWKSIKKWLKTNFFSAA